MKAPDPTRRLKKRYVRARYIGSYDDRKVQIELLSLFGELNLGKLYLKTAKHDHAQKKIVFRCERSKAHELAGALSLIKSVRIIPERISGSIKGATTKP